MMILFIFIVSLCLSWRGTLSKPTYTDAVRSDGIGYYSYLPAIFIYHDPTFSFTDSLVTKYPNLYGMGGTAFCNVIGGKRVDKYFIGESVLAAPFFLVAHLTAKISGQPADGFSLLYMIAVTIASIFYSCLGLFFLMRFFRRTGMRDRHITFILFLVYWATNLSEFAMWEPSMSHAYSFAMVSAFIYVAQSLFLSFRKKDLLWLGFLLGLITIIRPVNILVVLLLPFLAGNKETFFLFLKNYIRNPLWLIGSKLVFIAVIFIQLLAYKIQSGHWYVYAYTKEGFNFAKPHFWQCLFSYTNGAFVYVPLLFICLLGIIPVLRKNLFRGISFLVFFFILIWVISSWWYWTYAGAYGMRPLVEFIPVFAILLGELLLSIGTILRWTSALVVFLPLTALLQFQLWQYKNGIIGWMDMTKEKYWKIFLQSGDQFMWINTEPPMQDVPANAVKVISRGFYFDQPDPLVYPYFFLDPDDKHKSFVVRMGVPENNSPLIIGTIGDLTSDTTLDLNDLWCDVSLNCRVNTGNTDASLIGTIQHGDSTMSWFGYPLIRQIDEKYQWKNVHYFYKAPAVLKRSDRFVLKIEKQDEGEFKFDDLVISFYRLK
jgi:hypothetical protein